MKTHFKIVKLVFLVIAFFTFLGVETIRAQEIPGVKVDQAGNVGVGTLTPHSSSKLEIFSDTKGVLIPRITNLVIDYDVDQPRLPVVPVAPVEGLIIYVTDVNNEDVNGPYHWDSSPAPGKWVKMDASTVSWTDIIGIPNELDDDQNLTGGFLDGSDLIIGIENGNQLTIELAEIQNDPNAWKLSGNNSTELDFLGSLSTSRLRIGAGGDEIISVDPNGLVGINNISPVFDLDVFGRARMSDNNNNLILNSSTANSTVSNNIYIGESAGENNTTNGNYFIGYKAGIDNGGVANLAIGWQAGANANGKWNAFYGINSGLNSTGNTNVFGGRYSGIGSSLNESIIFGHKAGLGSGGDYNVYLGYGAGEYVNNSHNVAIGFNSLGQLAGEENIAIGAYAGSSCSGDNNNFIGKNAGITSTGSNNTFIGENSGKYNLGNNNIHIGDSEASINDPCLGGSDGDNNILIGTDVEIIQCDITGSIGIGENVQLDASNQIVLGGYTVEGAGTPVNWTTTSDSRFKENISETVSGLEFIKLLRPVQYNMDMDSYASFLNIPRDRRDFNGESRKANIKYTGFLAQEVEQAADNIGFDFSGVDKPKTPKGYYGLRYSEFVVPLVKAVQEQQVIIEQQEAQIKDLEKIAADQATAFTNILAEIEILKTRAQLFENE